MTDQEEMCGKLENIHFTPKTTQDLLTKHPPDEILIQSRVLPHSQLWEDVPENLDEKFFRKPKKALRRTMRNSTEAKFKYSLRSHRCKSLTTKFPFYE